MSHEKASPLVTGLALIATLGGFLFGYDTAVISGAVTSIDANFIDPLGLPETERDSLSGFTVASALFGCILGAAAAGFVAVRLGRKGGLALSAVLFLVSSIGSAAPELGLGPIGGMGPDALLPFNIYRIIGGIGVGIASMLSPLYIAEISPRAVRGRLVSYNQMAIVIGIVGVYFVNWAIATQGDDVWLKSVGWRLMFASEALPALLFLGLLLFAPESPRHLVQAGRPDAAMLVLTRLDGEAAARQTLGEIEESLQVRSAPLFTFGVGVVVCGLLLSVFQQAVGINAVLYYAPVIFQNMGASGDTALLQTVLVGAVNMAFTLVAIFTVDRWGRKPLLITGAIGMGAAMLTLSLAFATQSLGLVALLAMLAYIAAFAMSWGPVVWVLLSEMFPNSIKGKALPIAVAAQWIANLLVSWSFKVLDGSSALNAVFHHGFAYGLYGVMALLAAVFVWRRIPETKGHSLETMDQAWARGGSAVPGDRSPVQSQAPSS